MKRYKLFISGMIATVAITTSCVKDLETTPIDNNVIVSSNLGDRPGAMKQTLAKLYASFAVPGQDGVSGGGDISGIDNGFGVYTRALWMLQELSTDEAICAWNDQTVKDYHTQTWSATDVFNAAMYSRIIYTVSICNEFIRNTNGNSNPEIVRYNSEARFLRAFAYYHAIDMYGKPAFITEADKPGSFFPKQATSRKALFDYVESELIAILPTLGDPKFEYGRVDKAVAWMLLARLYLNAEVYTGTARNTDCITYANKVITEGGYILEPNYRLNFSGDNNTSREMIFAINYDGDFTRSYGGTTYIMHAALGGDHMFSIAYGFASGSEWGGNRTTKEFVNTLIDTLVHPLSTFMNGNYKTSDTLFTTIPDKRILLQALESWNIKNVGTFSEGVAVRKYTNFNADGSLPMHPHAEFASTDFPVFRLADAYLMYAEAVVRGGTGGSINTAVNYINELRDRAYQYGAYGSSTVSGRITATDLTLDFLLNERGRELYWEAVRRTDLIRFGKFTGSSYIWQWKGGSYEGQSTPSYRNLFPIPATEVAANPNIEPNPGY